MSTGGAKLVVVNASSGPSGLYDSRTKRFRRFCRVAKSRRGSQRVSTVIISSFGNLQKRFRSIRRSGTALGRSASGHLVEGGIGDLQSSYFRSALNHFSQGLQHFWVSCAVVILRALLR